MFGKNKRNTDTTDGAPAAATKGSSKADAAAYFERRGADIDQRYELQKAGAARAEAVVTDQQLVFQLATSDLGDDFALHPEQEWAIQADVHGSDGQPYAASVALFVDELVEPPSPGKTIYVLVDPADRTRLVADELWDPDMPGNQPGFGTSPVRWKVPEVCPNCGARVDQSTASLAEHPTCQMCHAPLPCEPLT
jgi:hypothetical protein